MQYPRNTSSRPLTQQSRITRSFSGVRPVANYMNDRDSETKTGEEYEGNFLSKMPLSLAMAYVPYQDFRDLNEPEQALASGTLFRELDLPFYGQRGRT